VTRTQAERRAATQAALLDATVQALVELGFGGASTTEICRRAGVSQGALFRYWPTKADLLAAAADHLLAQVRTAYASAFTGRASAKEALAALWETYRQPELQAAVELYVASRTDPDLAAALARIEPAHRAELQAIAARVVDPSLAALPGFAGFVELALAAVQGASLGAPEADAAGTRASVAAALEALAELLTAR
jgi:AcrR family transcriptional regulator